VLDKYTCDKCGHMFDTPLHELGCVDVCGIRDDFEYYDWLDAELFKDEEEKDWHHIDLGGMYDDDI
jgi:hypothetical protein